MQCKDVELVLEQEGLEPLPKEARAHLAECRDCRNYIADLTSLVDAAKKLPPEITPPDRVWISLRAQLEEEGIIRTPADVIPVEPVSWWQSVSAFFSNRVLATAMVGILIAAAAVFQIRSDRTTRVEPPAQSAAVRPVIAPAKKPVTEPNVAPPTVPQPSGEFDRTARDLNDQEPVATGMILTSTSPIDASLRDNLKKVNEFIAECEKHLKEQPQDELTREYLSAAYQQKAELLSAMIERGRSIN
ncbi:MAG TPA: hypothetical protein VJW94_19605 [Candidatus Acidoferrum sp.]|nr:hypothetical protein [Candidatus Acidoferrum sp.]